MTDKPSPEEHRRQVEAYIKERPRYVAYATALKRVLESACAVAVPERIVETRAKSVSSFAEKCIRKWAKYPDAVHQLTDLCGARVIVQTLEQVKAVKLFLEHNFTILERDDKGLLLSKDKFGYRDMHYLVRLKPDRALLFGFTQEEVDVIGGRVAEVQVRSVVQHAWADILHDRMYKAPLKLSSEAKRTGALLAAIMEDGDRTFDRLAGELDGMVANYTAYASRADVEHEIEVQSLILANETEAVNKPAIALKLVRLLGPRGDYKRVVQVLEPLKDIETPLGSELLLELGHALCRAHRATPQSRDYARGQQFLEKVVQACDTADHVAVPNLRKQTSLRARALSRLAWTWEAVDAAQVCARELYRQALETEPANPYHLANQLGFEIYCARNNSMIASMRTTLQRAIDTCREHAIAGTELPFALFTAGRLSLLMDGGDEALSWYARGLRHLFDGKSCLSESALDDELQWIERIHFGSSTPKEHGWATRLIVLARGYGSTCKSKVGEAASTDASKRVLIIAGGAATMKPELLDLIRPVLTNSLRHFRGTVISSGTSVGIPGCVAEVATQLKAEGGKQFELVGYIPKLLPADAPKDSRYDRFVQTDDAGFSSGQILRTWGDLFEAGVASDSVQLLGFGGGPLTAVEFRVALGLGAATGAVQCTGGAAEAILNDPVWAGVPMLLAMPLDAASARAFVTVPTHTHDPAQVLGMAQSFHVHYVKDNPKKLPENMRPWDKLPETYKTANLEQARYAVEILRAAGFDVRSVKGKPKLFDAFTKADIERMAELEHGRWNIERLRNGWRFGTPRDDARKLHDCLVSWRDLPDTIKQYDRNSVVAFPEVLAQANLEVIRTP